MRSSRLGDGQSVLMSDNRALRRALKVERSMRRLYERRLRDLLARAAFEEFRRVCRAESVAGCLTDDLAKVTTEAGDA